MSFDSHQTMQHIAHWPVGGISVGINWPWLDDVDGDPTRSKITGQPARHALQGMGAFTGKTVLILGGSRGIGAAIVRRFVTDGANVRFTYAGSKDAAERLAQETGATAVFTDSADRDAVIDVVRKSGALDILVVNAGIGVFGDALELNADDIDHLFKINIHAPYHASVEAARQMPEGGRILIIGSVNGDRMPVAGIIGDETTYDSGTDSTAATEDENCLTCKSAHKDSLIYYVTCITKLF